MGNTNTLQMQNLLATPVCMMTGAQFLLLMQNAGQMTAKVPAEVVPEKRYEYGIEGLAKIFGCSIPTANRIKKSGIIDAAISQVGRKIVVDVDLALELMKKNNARIK